MKGEKLSSEKLLPSELAFKIFLDKISSNADLPAELKAAITLDLSSADKVLLKSLQLELKKEQVA